MNITTSKAVTSIWCFDAFQCLTGRTYTTLTIEVVSRINAVLESLCFFDKVVVGQRYYEENFDFFQRLQEDEKLVEIVDSSRLIHTEMLSQGEISFDAILYNRSIEEINKEGRLWFLEHNNHPREELLICEEEFIDNVGKQFPLFQMWQWSSCNEIADHADATLIAPNSLMRLARYDKKQHKVDDVVARMKELERHLSGAVRSIETLAHGTEAFFSFPVPPLFAIFCDAHNSDHDPVETLRRLRHDTQEIRATRAKLENDLRSTNSFKERGEIVDHWKNDWTRLVQMQFKKPSLLKASVSNSEIAKTVLDTAALKASGLTALVTSLLDHRERWKTYRRFQVFTRIYDQAGNALLDDKLLQTVKQKFGVNELLRRPELYTTTGTP